MIKPEVLGEEGIRSHCLGEGMYWQGERYENATDSTPVLMPQFKNIAEAQRDDTHKKDCQMFLEWGHETCPHTGANTPTHCYRYACGQCWQEFKDYVEGL